MKETPLLFNGAMVRAILDGRKTQTRRLAKGTALEWLAPGMFTPAYVASPDNGLSPVGYAGDRLWVRETWSTFTQGFDTAEESTFAVYRADTDRPEPKKWIPSIHMPRWACRLLLDVVDVRIERLQDISEADCWAEGIERSEVSPTQASTMFSDYAHPRRAFNLLWESVYGAEAWDANPWVWVVTFKRATP